MYFSSYNALNVIPLKCVSINNQDCKIRSEIIDINTNGSLFYPYRILVAAAIISMIHMPNCVILMLLKI